MVHFALGEDIPLFVGYPMIIPQPNTVIVDKETKDNVVDVEKGQRILMIIRFHID